MVAKRNKSSPDKKNFKRVFMYSFDPKFLKSQDNNPNFFPQAEKFPPTTVPKIQLIPQHYPQPSIYPVNLKRPPDPLINNHSKRQKSNEANGVSKTSDRIHKTFFANSSRLMDVTFKVYSNADIYFKDNTIENLIERDDFPSVIFNKQSSKKTSVFKTLPFTIEMHFNNEIPDPTSMELILKSRGTNLLCSYDKNSIEFQPPSKNKPGTYIFNILKSTFELTTSERLNEFVGGNWLSKYSISINLEKVKCVVHVFIKTLSEKIFSSEFEAYSLRLQSLDTSRPIRKIINEKKSKEEFIKYLLNSELNTKVYSHRLLYFDSSFLIKGIPNQEPITSLRQPNFSRQTKKFPPPTAPKTQQIPQHYPNSSIKPLLPNPLMNNKSKRQKSNESNDVSETSDKTSKNAHKTFSANSSTLMDVTFKVYTNANIFFKAPIIENLMGRDNFPSAIFNEQSSNEKSKFKTLPFIIEMHSNNEIPDPTSFEVILKSRGTNLLCSYDKNSIEFQPPSENKPGTYIFNILKSKFELTTPERLKEFVGRNWSSSIDPICSNLEERKCIVHVFIKTLSEKIFSSEFEVYSLRSQSLENSRPIRKILNEEKSREEFIKYLLNAELNTKVYSSRLPYFDSRFLIKGISKQEPSIIGKKNDKKSINRSLITGEIYSFNPGFDNEDNRSKCSPILESPDNDKPQTPNPNIDAIFEEWISGYGPDGTYETDNTCSNTSFDFINDEMDVLDCFDEGSS